MIDSSVRRANRHIDSARSAIECDWKLTTIAADRRFGLQEQTDGFDSQERQSQVCCRSCLELSGVFGPPAVIPLVSDLLSPALLDAMTLGFARWAGNSSGLVQNDGHVFPEFGRRAERTFCSYCTVVHHTRRGRERCGSADCGGVKLLAGVPLEAAEAASIEQAESRTGKVVCYYIATRDCWKCSRPSDCIWESSANRSRS